MNLERVELRMGAREWRYLLELAAHANANEVERLHPPFSGQPQFSHTQVQEYIAKNRDSLLSTTHVTLVY